MYLCMLRLYIMLRCKICIILRLHSKEYENCAVKWGLWGPRHHPATFVYTVSRDGMCTGSPQ